MLAKLLFAVHFNFFLLFHVASGKKSKTPEILPDFFANSQEQEHITSVTRKTWSDIVKESCKKNKSSCNEIEPQQQFKHLASLRHPIVIEGSPHKNIWPAFRHQELWGSLDEVSSLFNENFGLSKVSGVQSSKSSPIFVYEEKGRLLGKTSKFVKNIAMKKVTLKGKTFFNKISTSSSVNGYYYYSRSLPSVKRSQGNGDAHSETAEIMPNGYLNSMNSMSTKMEKLATEFAPQDMFNITYNPKVNPKLKDTSYSKDTSQSIGSYLWLSGVGITASCHYDRSHNFFAQILGKKRFYLWSPSQLKSLHIYPFYHPRDRQSQLINLEWGEGNIRSYPFLSIVGNRIPSYFIDLEPGDLLYLPPYWAHRVTSLTPSIAVNVWSPGEELYVGSLLNEIGLPKGIEGILNISLVNEDDRKKRKHASGMAAAFVREVILHTLDLFTDDQKIKGNNKKERKKKREKRRKIRRNKIFNSKFEPSRASLDIIQALFKSRYLPIGHLWKSCIHFEPSRCPKLLSLSDSERKDVSSKVNEIVQTFQPLTHVPYGQDIAKTLLKDYVERLATFVAGVEGSCMYLRCIGESHSFSVVA
jgi:hypothetical protein